jgi:type II secretory pathway pseudopilin PulG
MTGTALRTRTSQRGSGLVELLVAVVLIGVVMVAVFGLLFRTSDESRRVSGIVESRQNARLAVQLLERDVRMAGSGWGRARVVSSSNGTPLELYGINPGSGAVAGSDSIEIIGAWSNATALRSSMPNASAIIKAADVNGFKDNDLCVITNGASAHLFQVTHVSQPPGDLQHNPSSPLNVPGGFSNWPSGGYGTGASVFKIDRVIYRLDAVNFRRPCLVRQEFGKSPQVAAWDVKQFTVQYRMQDGSWTRNPSSVAFIDRIRPALVMRIDSPTHVAWVDSCWAEIRPRTF